MSLLLGNGSVELEARDAEGRTALTWAGELGHEKVVQMLLD
jgi:ankyrin repeat protein